MWEQKWKTTWSAVHYIFHVVFSPGVGPIPSPLLDRRTWENTSGTQGWVIAVRRCTRFVAINFVIFVIILLCWRRFQFARIYVTSLFNGCSASLTCNFRFLFTSVDRCRAVSKRCGLDEQIHWFRIEGRSISVKKNLPFQNYPDSSRRGLSQPVCSIGYLELYLKCFNTSFIFS